MSAMTRWGVGPTITAYFVALAVPGVVLRVAWPDAFVFPLLKTPRLVAGGVLAALGIGLEAWALASVHPAFTAGRLCTTGPFGVCRHPVYACWAMLITPGLALLLDTWLLLAAVAPMYVLLRLYVRREEQWLEAQFGDAFRAYRRRVPAVLPFGWITRLFVR